MNRVIEVVTKFITYINEWIEAYNYNNIRGISEDEIWNTVEMQRFIC